MNITINSIQFTARKKTLPNIPKPVLKQYIQSGLTISEIAKQTKLPYSWINDLIVKYNLNLSFDINKIIQKTDDAVLNKTLQKLHMSFDKVKDQLK